jgi:predicted Zn-dependent protease
MVAAAASADPAPPADAKLEVPPAVLKEFQAIEALVGKSAYAEAGRKIEVLLPQLKDAPAARALLLRNQAALFGMQKHYAHAAMILEECLAMHSLSETDSGKAMFELAQYYVAAENYPKAANALGEWIGKSSAAKPEHHLMLADLQTRLNRHADAAASMEIAIAASPRPKPEWYQLLVGLYHEQHDLDHCARVLAALIEQNPGQALYWSQLTGVYQEAGKLKQALAVQQLMYKNGLLTKPAEILQLAQVLRYQGLSVRAAELLQLEIEKGRVEPSARNLGLTADLWLEAKELRKAAATLEKSLAVSYSGDGQHRLGQIYSELHEWSKAQQALSRALADGGLKNPGGAYLLLGLAHYRTNAKDRAREAFGKALASPSVRNTAKRWLEHIEKESGRNRG